MTDERATFEQTRTRLEEILVQVRKKDTSLEQSLDLLEEGVRLANTCNELIDQTSWRKAEGEEPAEGESPGEAVAMEPAGEVVEGGNGEAAGDADHATDEPADRGATSSPAAVPDDERS